MIDNRTRGENATESERVADATANKNVLEAAAAAAEVGSRAKVAWKPGG
jgi:hypothetical protein